MTPRDRLTGLCNAVTQYPTWYAMVKDGCGS
jgi:hypothetical protein